MTLELIGRLDAAQEPDHVLDGDIWQAVNGWPENDGYRFGGVWFRRDPEDDVAFEQPPRLTASIDAALTLVPEGMVWVVDSGEGYKPGALVAREIGYDDSRSYGATPAIALCIAALWARGDA